MKGQTYEDFLKSNSCHGFQYLLGVALGLHLGKDFINDAVPVNDKSSAIDAVIVLAEHFLGAPAAVGFDDGQIFVHQQGKGQVVFLDKILVALAAVGADAEYFVALFFEFCKIVPQVAGFFGTGWGVVLRVEVKDEFFSFKRCQGKAFPILILAAEIGGRLAFRKMGHKLLLFGERFKFFHQKTGQATIG